MPVIEDNLSDFLASLTVPNMTEKQLKLLVMRLERIRKPYRHSYVWQYRKDRKGCGRV